MDINTELAAISICPSSSRSHRGYGSDAGRVFTSTSFTPSQRGLFSDFGKSFGNVRANLTEGTPDLHVNGSVTCTKKTVKLRRRLSVLFASEAHHAVFFHIHPVIRLCRHTAASVYVFVHWIPARSRVQAPPLLCVTVCSNIIYKVEASIKDT